MALRCADRTWTIPAELDRVAPLVIAAAGFLGQRGLRGKPLFASQLALEEIVTNAVRHACGGDGSRDVHVRVTIDELGVWLTVEDDGRPFNPLREAPTPDVRASLEEQTVGGWGLFLVKAKVDGWAYEREGSTNRTRMRVAAA